MGYVCCGLCRGLDVKLYCIVPAGSLRSGAAGFFWGWRRFVCVFAGY